jgi:hypothetical protein
MMGLGPADRAIVARLQPEIVTVLRNASAAARAGTPDATARSLRWFGDNSPGWMGQLSSKLNRLASIVNNKDIEVSFSGLRHRCGDEYAAANRPTGGWNDFSEENAPMSAAQGRNFVINLNLSWNGAPTYSPAQQPGDSKFQTLVHECTHLILDTDDDAYGVPMCLATAAATPALAKKTADNWGYFVEEFR